MLSALIWNIRFFKSHQAFNRVHQLHSYHKFSIIALLEPFQRANQINKCKRKLGMVHVGANINGKIWYFIDDAIVMEVIDNTDQQITVKLPCTEHGVLHYIGVC